MYILLVKVLLTGMLSEITEDYCEYVITRLPLQHLSFPNGTLSLFILRGDSLNFNYN